MYALKLMLGLFFVGLVVNSIKAQQTEDEQLNRAESKTGTLNAKAAGAGDIINIAECINGNWISCAKSIQFVYGLFSWNDGGTVKILGQDCTIQVKGRIRKFKWVYDGRCRCPFGREAESKGWKSARGAAEHAVMEFFNINQDLIKSMQG